MKKFVTLIYHPCFSICQPFSHSLHSNQQSSIQTMNIDLNFEKEGFQNVDVKTKDDCLCLRTNVKSREEFQHWREVFSSKNKQCFNSYKLFPVGTRKLFRQQLICLHGSKHKGKIKTSTGCKVLMDVTISIVHKRSPDHVRNFPCFVKIYGHHNHPLESADYLNQLRVSSSTKKVFEMYFEQGMTPAQAHRHHVLKMDLCDDVRGQADHTINPSQRSILYMWDVWRKREHGGLNPLNMVEAIQKYAQANPEVLINYQHFQNSLCVVLITPFMFRAHKALKEAGEVVFVYATSCVDQLNTAITPFMCAGPGGAVPLAIVLTSSQDEATLTKGFAMVKEALGESGFYGRGEPHCFITDNCEPERKALASTWPTSKQFLCIFHVLQQVWRWLLDSKHGIPKENRQDLMKMTKSLVYASSKDEFLQLWKEVEAHALLEKYCNFKSYMTTLVQRKEEWGIAFRAGAVLRGHHTNNYAEATMCIIKDIVLSRCKAYNTVQLLVFMAEIFDAYMRQRLVDVALRRRRWKSITVERYPPDAVKSIGESLYTVQSQSDQTQTYEVDLTIGMCTCKKGQTGAICKHQVACAEYGMTAVPQILMLDCSSRQWLAALAVSAENAPKEEFFKGLIEVEEEERCKDKGLEQIMIIESDPLVNIESDPLVKIESDPLVKISNEDVERCEKENVSEDIGDVTTDSEVAAQALKNAVQRCANAETQVALLRFIKQINSIKTPNQLNSLLNCAGSSLGYNAVGRGRIPCQPTSISRRSLGMPRGAAPIGKGRRPAAAAIASKPKRPRNLAHNIECNVANAKSHCSGH